MARRLLLNGRMGMLQDDTPVVAPLTADQFAGPGVARVGYGEYNQRALLAEWAELLEQPPPAILPTVVGLGVSEGCP
jgi:hypothetical protein